MSPIEHLAEPRLGRQVMQEALAVRPGAGVASGATTKFFERFPAWTRGPHAR
jgi:hypothetical protein